MSSDKRQFDNFDDFPGKIDSTDGAYKFPVLYHTDSNGNDRSWFICMRLIKSRNKKGKKSGIDWDVLLDNTVMIKKAHLKDKPLPENTITQMWVETGVIGGKSTRHEPTYPTMKNKDKSNERHSLKQGLVEARSKYLKKLENGFMEKKDFDQEKREEKKEGKKKGKKKGKEIKGNSNQMYFPMLVRKYEDEKKHIVYPVYVQPKLDGARMLAYLSKAPKQNPTYKDVILYTRQKKPYVGYDNMRKCLLPVLVGLYDVIHKNSIYIDGELYKHGMDLQTISGAVRNPDRENIDKYKGIKYHVFDVFNPAIPDMKFKDRLEMLEDVFSVVDCEDIVQVDTKQANNETEEEAFYQTFLRDKYEGSIVRNSSSLYLTHPTKNNTKIRSKFVLKRKMKFSDEYEVVGFTEGTKGRDVGAILWICQTTDGKQFNTTPKNTTYQERYKLFKEANTKDGFNKKYKGRMMTVEYEDLSKDKIPLRAKAVGFREHI